MAKQTVEPQPNDDLADYSAAAQDVVDRAMARSLIEYGERKNDLKAKMLGQGILAALPVKQCGTAAKQKVDDSHVDFDAMFAETSGDKTATDLAKDAKKAHEDAQADGRVAANRWVLHLKKGEDKPLSPRPKFPGQVNAFINAFTDAKDARLGITVRRRDHETVLRRFPGQGFWYTGKIVEAWEIRVFNNSKEDGPLMVTVETSPTV